MMRLKFDCCYPVNSTTGFQKSHANVFTRCRKPNCFMPPYAMKRKKRTRACVLVVSPKNVVAGFRGQSPIRICANIIGLHTSNLPPSRYIPSNSQSHTTDTEPTVYLTSESAVTRHPSLSPLVARCLDQSRTSCLIQKISPTNNAIGCTNPAGTRSRGLDGGLLAAPRRRQNRQGEAHMLLSRGRHVGGVGGDGQKGWRFFPSQLKGTVCCLVHFKEKKGIFTRHSVTGAFIQSAVCAAQGCLNTQRATHPPTLLPTSIIHFIEQTTRLDPHHPTIQPTNTIHIHIHTYHAPLALQLPRPRRPRRPQSPRAPRRLRPRRRRVGSPLHDGRHRRPRHRALRRGPASRSSRVPACC